MHLKLRSFLVATCFLPTAFLSSHALATSPLDLNTPSTSTTQLAQNTYPTELVSTYMDACVGGAANSGISREVATLYCRCSIDRIQSAYTLEQFLQLVQSIAPGQLPPALEQIATACAVNIPN